MLFYFRKNAGDESMKVKSKLADEICIPLFNHGDPTQWCCTTVNPPNCGYTSYQDCKAHCH